MADRQEPNLMVMGTGRVQVAPDEAIVHFGIITQAKTAGEAVAMNAKQTQAVIDAVSAEQNHGVTTSGLNVFPIFEHQPNTSIGKIVGFQATNGVEVTAKVAYVGQIYDAGISAGANQSSGITFRVRDEAPYREEALRRAVEEALREAKVVAGAAAVEIRGVESIQIESGGGRVMFRAESLDAKAPATPVLPDRQEIVARVHLQLRTRDQPEARPSLGKAARAGKAAAPPRSHGHTTRHAR